MPKCQRTATSEDFPSPLECPHCDAVMDGLGGCLCHGLLFGCRNCGVVHCLIPVPVETIEGALKASDVAIALAGVTRSPFLVGDAHSIAADLLAQLGPVKCGQLAARLFEICSGAGFGHSEDGSGGMPN